MINFRNRWGDQKGRRGRGKFTSLQVTLNFILPGERPPNGQSDSRPELMRTLLIKVILGLCRRCGSYQGSFAESDPGICRKIRSSKQSQSPWLSPSLDGCQSRLSVTVVFLKYLWCSLQERVSLVIAYITKSMLDKRQLVDPTQKQATFPTTFKHTALPVLLTARLSLVVTSLFFHVEP